MKQSLRALHAASQGPFRCPNPRRVLVEPQRTVDVQRRTQVSAAELQFGQPLHETHPHILNAGELTPGITALEYANRRAKLARAMPNGSVAIFSAAEVKWRSGAVFYDYHQDPDFFYLTGFNEPEALA
ncbi:hypothetical protein LTS18_008288, partial [Coniosporium uncinatum]